MKGTTDSGGSIPEEDLREILQEHLRRIAAPALADVSGGLPYPLKLRQHYFSSSEGFRGFFASSVMTTFPSAANAFR